MVSQSSNARMLHGGCVCKSACKHVVLVLIPSQIPHPNFKMSIVSSYHYFGQCRKHNLPVLMCALGCSCGGAISCGAQVPDFSREGREHLPSVSGWGLLLLPCCVETVVSSQVLWCSVEWIVFPAQGRHTLRSKAL